MVNPLKVAFSIDEAITKTLTNFCWWTDKHFEKDNVFWVKCTFVFITPFLNSLLDFLFDKYSPVSEYVLDFMKHSLPMFVLLYFGSNYLPFFKKAFENATKSPNKNRYDSWMYFIKILILMTACIETLFFYKLFPVATYGAHWVDAFCFELFIYFLCTEPLPPSMKKEKSHGNMKLSTG